MSFAIIRQQKIKSAEAFNGIVAHNKRETNAKNIDKTRTHKNINLIQSPYKDFDDFVEKHRAKIREHNKKHGTKNRMVRKITKGKDKGEYKSMMQEFIFTHSQGALTEEESIKFLEEALAFIREWYPDLEIVSADIHLDEATPHIHIIVSYFNTVQNKFVQADLQKKGKTDIDAIRNAWQKRIESKGYTLKKQDGSIVQTHDGSKADIKVAEAKQKAIKEVVQKGKDKIYTGKMVTRNGKTGRETWKGRALRQESKLEKIEKSVEAMQGRISTLEEEVKTLKIENNDLKTVLAGKDTTESLKDAQIANLTAENESLKAENSEIKQILGEAVKILNSLGFVYDKIKGCFREIIKPTIDQDQTKDNYIKPVL